MSRPSMKTPPRPRPQAPGLFSLLQPYSRAILSLAALTILANALNLIVPRIIARAIDGFVQGQPVIAVASRELLVVALGIFVFSYLQTVTQTYASERVARDLRTRLAAKISAQDHAQIQQLTPAMLLTHLTADVDAIKIFVAQAIASLISSVFLIIGAAALLLSIDWKLRTLVLSHLPL